MLRNLMAEMVRENLEDEDIAETLDVYIKTVKNKISEKTPILFKEAITIRDKHFPKMSLEYLFKSDLEEEKSSDPQTQSQEVPT